MLILLEIDAETVLILLEIDAETVLILLEIDAEKCTSHLLGGSAQLVKSISPLTYLVCYYLSHVMIRAKY